MFICVFLFFFCFGSVFAGGMNIERAKGTKVSHVGVLCDSCCLFLRGVCSGHYFSEFDLVWLNTTSHLHLLLIQKRERERR